MCRRSVQEILPRIKALDNLGGQCLGLLGILIEHRVNTWYRLRRCRPLEAREPVATADDEKSLADLWDSKMVRRNDFGIHTVPRAFQLPAHSAPRASAIMTLKVGDVLHHEVTGAVVANHPQDVLFEKVTPQSAARAELLARFRERLAWEPRAKHVVFWNHRGVDLPKVALRPKSEIAFVERRQLGIDLAGKDANVP